MFRNIGALLIIIVGIPNFTYAQSNMSTTAFSDNFLIQMAETETNQWIIILPGSSGLNIFKDDHYYFDIADELNAQFNVLLIDYKKAYRGSGRKVKETTGEKILWVTETAIEWAIQNNHIKKEDSISLIGWSLAGEGLILLSNNKLKCEQLNIKSIAMYYPSNAEKIVLNSELPILIQVGGRDNVINPISLMNNFAGNINTEFIVYPEANHGFDIISLAKGKSLRFPPLFGKKYIFKFNQQANQAAKKKLFDFLERTN